MYEFDTIGNRTKAAGGTTLPGSPNHAVNTLNQYTSIGGVSPGYDDDGNLTSDAGGNTHGSARTYQWDAENQLRQVNSGAVAAYRYDPHGRRISKTAGSLTTWFIYDGWNLIAEYQSGALTRTHLWGLDLSGTTQGAGGVGGLLCTSIGGTKYYPLYDGNGNICQYLDGSGGLAAHYEYSPFGHLLNSPGTGSTPASFNFRFSTKFNDPETDFYYYGFRYYSSWMARWINRDPIGERGGLNLHAMVGNNATNSVDVHGMLPLAALPYLIDAYVVSEQLFVFCLGNIGGDSKPECFSTQAKKSDWFRKSRETVRGAVSKCTGAVAGALAAFSKVPWVATASAKVIEKISKIADDYASDEMLDKLIGDSPPVDPHCGQRACYTRTPPWNDRFKPDSDPWDVNARWWDPEQQLWQHWPEAPPGAPVGPSPSVTPY